MIVLGFYVLAAFGLAYIVGHSRISRPFRILLAGPREYSQRCDHCGKLSSRRVPDVLSGWPCEHCFTRNAIWESADVTPYRPRDFFVELVECPACFGTWTGLALGLLMPTLLPLELPRAAAGLALATFTAATNYLLGRASGLVSRET